MRCASSVSSDEDSVHVSWSNGEKSEFNNLWLRAHCNCAACCHPSSKQKLVHFNSLPMDLRADSVRPSVAFLLYFMLPSAKIPLLVEY